MPIERNEPPYVQVANDLRSQIDLGQYRPGDVLPSVNEVADLYDVSPSTAQRAFKILKDLGLTTAVTGRGTLVAGPVQPHYRRARDRYQLLAQTGNFLADDETSRIISSGVQGVTQDAARGLGTSEAEGIARHRVTSRGGVIVERSVSWFPASIAERCPALLSTDRIPSGTLAYVVQRTGVIPQHGTERFYARLADRSELADLGMAEAGNYDVAAVLVCEHTVSGPDGVITFEIGVSPAMADVLYTFDLPRFNPPGNPVAP